MGFVKDGESNGSAILSILSISSLCPQFNLIMFVAVALLHNRMETSFKDLGESARFQAPWTSPYQRLILGQTLSSNMFSDKWFISF
jgi:hypothetical protein